MTLAHENLDTLEAATLTEAQHLAEDVIRDRLESRFSAKGESPRIFHNIFHAEVVQEKALHTFDRMAKEAPWFLLMDEPKVLSSDLAQVRAYFSIISLGHDLVQKASVDESGRLHRNHGNGPDQSEGLTAIELVEIISQLKAPEGNRYFEGVTAATVQRDIAATNVTFSIENVAYKGIQYDRALKVAQPDLPNASALGVILAMADLKTACTSDFEIDRLWSNAEFLESNPWLVQSTQKGLTNMSNDEKYNAVVSIKDWVHSEIGFLVEQQLALVSDLTTLRQELNVRFGPDKAERVIEVLREEFSTDTLEGNIEKAVLRAQKVDLLFADYTSAKASGKVLDKLVTQFLEEVRVV